VLTIQQKNNETNNNISLPQNYLAVSPNCFQNPFGVNL